MRRNDNGSPISFDDYDAVIFDLDGTLVDSMWVWEDVDITYLGNYGYEVPEDLHRSLDGLSIIETAYYFQKRFGIKESAEEMISEWNRLAKQYYGNRVPLKKGVAEFLYALAKEGFKCGIASSNSKELIETVLNAHDITRFFDCVLSGSEIERSKPAPDIYLEVAKRRDADPSRILVFEDIVQGIMAGKNAGMTVCAVEDDYSLDLVDEKKRLSDHWIDDFTELLDERSRLIR